jgi:hypothetical protein
MREVRIRLASPSEVVRLYRLHMGNDDFLAKISATPFKKGFNRN